MSSKDTHLYGAPKRPRNLNSGKEISSSTSLAFTSQLTSLISSADSSKSASSARSRPKKDDIFAKPNRNTAKRAKRDLAPDPSGAFEQKHTTNGETLDKSVWERSRRKMEEKARLYAAMKRGDVEDADERYAVDFDAKWAEARAEGKQEDSDEDLDDEQPREEVEYIDEFGRTRTGSRLDAMRAQQQIEGRTETIGARPLAPSSVIHGDAIQHEAFNPDELRATQMEELAKKRDRSLTPPPETHFDGNQEIRTKGTAFYQFSGDAEERKRQMANLEHERLETEKRRAERDSKLAERKEQIEKRRREILSRNAKRKADEFLADLGAQMGARHVLSHEEEDKTHADGEDDAEPSTATEMTNRIEAAIEKEEDE